METANLLVSFSDKTSFSRKELYSTIQAQTDFNKDACNYIIRKMIKSGEIFRIGHGLYSASPSKQIYSYENSETATAIKNFMQNNYPLVEYSIFETCQFNEFFNHLIGKNSIFVYIEKDCLDFVFDSIKDIFPGKVLLNPDATTFFNYFSENIIVLKPLITEAPITKVHTNTLEKTIVDAFADNILNKIISAVDLKIFVEDTFTKYLIDEKSLFRYARRRNCKDKIKEYIETNTEI